MSAPPDGGRPGAEPRGGLRLQGVTYRYPSARSPSVEGVDLTVSPGELALLTGPTGCGKSTLIRLAAGLLQRHGQGEFSGEVRIDGVDPALAAPRDRVQRLGFVSQEPGDQRVAGAVGDELAFGMESAGATPEAIEAAIPSTLEAVGLRVSPARAAGALSGGQVQRLVTGAALAAGGHVLLLDEPLAQLDPGGARDLMGRLRALADGGVAILVIEHRLEAALPWVDRLVAMDAGRVVADAPRAALTPGSALTAQLRGLGLSLPGPLDLADRLVSSPPPSRANPSRADPSRADPPRADPSRGAPLLQATGLRHRYPGADSDALAGLDLSLWAGERIALLGANGAGKSTLLGALAGRVDAGPVTRGGRTVAVPQDPDLALFCATVQEELGYGPRELGLPATRIEDAAAALSVEDLLDRAPQALSRGQRLRTAVAAALSCEPSLLALDEPTSGQDSAQIERMMWALRGALRAGALIFATHDVGLALRHATRAIVMVEGRVLADGPPFEILTSLPPEVPLHLPPLAAWCRAEGRDLAPPAALAAAIRGEGPAAVAASLSTLTPLVSRAEPTEMEAPADGPPGGEAPADSPEPRAPRGFDPRTRLGLVCCAGILAITLERPASLLALTLACAAPLIWLRVEARWWRRGLAGAALIVWSTVLSQGLFYAEQPRVSLAHVGPLHLWREGVVYGLAQSMRFVGLSLAGIALSVSTPPDRMYAALLRLRVPFGLALMASTALRFLPEIGREALSVRAARAARGRPLWRRPPWAWLREEVALLRPLVARSWRRAQNLAESLDTRGFDPLAPRAVRRPLRMRTRDRVALAAAGALTLSVAGARLVYGLYTAETWYHPALRPLYGFVRAWL